MSDDLLDSLLLDAQPGSPPGACSSSNPAPLLAKQAIQKVNYSHDAMIDMIIANPAASQGSIALAFGYSQSWVSQVMASDAFQARMAERKDELVDPTIRATVEDRFKGLVLRSMEILKEKLDQPSDKIPDNLALRTLELASRAAGYGARMEPLVAPVNMEVHLNVLSENLTSLLKRKKQESLPAAFDMQDD